MLTINDPRNALEELSAFGYWGCAKVTTSGSLGVGLDVDGVFDGSSCSSFSDPAGSSEASGSEVDSASNASS